MSLFIFVGSLLLLFLHLRSCQSSGSSLAALAASVVVPFHVILHQLDEALHLGFGSVLVGSYQKVFHSCEHSIVAVLILLGLDLVSTLHHSLDRTNDLLNCLGIQDAIRLHGETAVRTYAAFNWRRGRFDALLHFSELVKDVSHLLRLHIGINTHMLVYLMHDQGIQPGYVRCSSQLAIGTHGKLPVLHGIPGKEGFPSVDVGSVG